MLSFGDDPGQDALDYIEQLEDHIRDLTKKIAKATKHDLMDRMEDDLK